MTTKTEKKKKDVYGVKQNEEVYLFNCAKHPLHPWSSHQFVWGGLRFKRLEQCLGFHKATHFKLGKEVKQKILEAKTGWDVVKVIKEQKIPTDADWKGWGRWVSQNLLSILRQMAKESPRFREALMEIQEPVIGLCTKDKSLGTYMDSLPKKKKDSGLEPSNWVGRNLLGKELGQLRAEIRILEEEEEDSSDNDGGDEETGEGATGGGNSQKRPAGPEGEEAAAAEGPVPLKRQLTQPLMFHGQPLSAYE